MASDGIRPSSDFFFLRLRFMLRRGPRRGVQAQNALFSKTQNTILPGLTRIELPANIRFRIRTRL